MMYWQSTYAPWYGSWGEPFLGLGIALLVVLLVWSAVWKALALWSAARDGSKIWFVVLFLVNTVGILEILYLYIFRKKRAETERPSENPQ